ncbi:MAG: PA14 domain-containing protein [Myxococcales bacterium]|nr:PA14 domain-containing protein [Myxococcales bacterium]
MGMRPSTYLALALIAAASGCKFEASTEYSASTRGSASAGSTSGGEARTRAKPKAKAKSEAKAKVDSKARAKTKAKVKARTSASGAKHSVAIRRAKKPLAPIGLKGSLAGRLGTAGKLKGKLQGRVKAAADARAEAEDQDTGREGGQEGAGRDRLKLGRKPDQVGTTGGSGDGRSKLAPKPGQVGTHAQTGGPSTLPKPSQVGPEGGTAAKPGLHRAPTQVKPVPPPEAPPTNEFGYEDPVLGCFEGHVFFIPERSKALPVSYQGAEPKSVLYACEWDIPTRKWKKGFPGVEDRFEWFAIRYAGAFHVAEGGEYTFRISSDDGSKLYIDGKLVIDNDGTHGPKSKKGKVTLTPGDHEMVLEYFQGPRYSINLQVFVTPPGGEEGLFSVRD